LKEKLSRLNLGWEAIVLAILLLVALNGAQNRTSSPNRSFVTQIPNLEQAVTEEEIKRVEKEYESNPGGNRQEMAFILFRQLYQKNQQLAVELGRIPEFADSNVSQEDLEGLKNLVRYYLKSEDDLLELRFKQFMNVGKKKYRKFCTPLQAIFWLAKKGKPVINTSLGVLLKRAWGNYQGEGWKDFNEVIDRLNSPELVSRYMLDNFSFVYHPGGTPYSPKYFFKIKHGTFCLKRAGYDARYTVVGGNRPRNHLTCVYTENSKFYTMDNGRIIGPFKSRRACIKYIERIHGID